MKVSYLGAIASVAIPPSEAERLIRSGHFAVYGSRHRVRSLRQLTAIPVRVLPLSMTAPTAVFTLRNGRSKTIGIGTDHWPCKPDYYGGRDMGDFFASRAHQRSISEFVIDRGQDSRN